MAEAAAANPQLTTAGVRFSLPPGDFAAATTEADAGDHERRQLKKSISIDPYDVSCKVMLVGDSGTGKTSFLHQFKDSKFPGSTFISTVGVDYRSKTLPVDVHKVRFQVWDTAGTERYRSITSAYYRDADSILLFYDLTSRPTFNNVRAWLTDIREYGSEDVFIILVANKADLESEREVRSQEGQRLAQECDIVCFMETSAKTGHNVDLCHQTIGRRLLAKHNFQVNGPSGSGSSHQTDASRHKLGHQSSSRSSPPCGYC